MRVGIVGATGNVGRMVVQRMIAQGMVKPDQLLLFASARSAGSTLTVEGVSLPIHAISADHLAQCQFVVFNTETEVSRELVPIALKAGATVIDSSSHYRLDDDVPLIIPPVNIHLVAKPHQLYAHANCLASPIATVLAPLHRHFRATRVNVSTYQSVSGAGKAAMDECWVQTQQVLNGQAAQSHQFPKQIAFNVIPQVGNLMQDGFTEEEFKIVHELKKVIDENLAITATAVRVPVMVGHAIAMNIEFADKINLMQIEATLRQAPNVRLSENHYSTPVEVVGQDDVLVGRLRLDHTVRSGLQCWLCSDNLRRGAATDAIEILRALLESRASKF